MYNNYYNLFLDCVNKINFYNNYIKSIKCYFTNDNFIILTEDKEKKEIYKFIINTNQKISYFVNNKLIFSFVDYLSKLSNDNYEKIINNTKDINISKNEYNKIKSSSLINTETICVLYLSDYIYKLGNDIEEAYKILDNEMKNKYQSINEFKTYIETNKNKMTTKADKCTKNGKDYIVIDNNNNTYTFTEQSVMNYKVNIKFNS